MLQMRNNKKVLLTGATGFLGSYIIRELSKQYDVLILGRKKAENVDIIADLKNGIPSLNLPELELVVHAAGKAHVVPKTEEEKQDFFDVNLKGTENLLEALSTAGSLPKKFVFISTVAVYGKEAGVEINEESQLLAEDPYGLSKKMAEEKIVAWGKLHSVKTTILRLPLIIGKDAPGNLGAMINGIKKGYYFNIGKGLAKRSMVLAEDVARIIPQASDIGGIYNLTDGKDPSYGELSEKIGTIVNKKIKHLPVFLAKRLANTLSVFENLLGKKLPFSNRVYNKMTNSLTFSSKKAQESIKWKPQPVLEYINKVI